MKRLFFLLVLVGLAACGGQPDRNSQTAEKSGQAESPGVPTYSGDIRSIFTSRCVMCHGEPSILPQGTPNGLYLDTYEHVMQGSNYFSVIQPGDPENSLLVTMVKKGTMPPENLNIPPLTEEQIETITRWVTAGAPKGTPPRSTP